MCASVCAGLFAFLDDLADPKMYFGMGILLRGVQAVGVSAYFTATYAFLVEEWRGSRLSLALGVYEAFTGLGMILGPITGSILYRNSFFLPFSKIPFENVRNCPQVLADTVFLSSSSVGCFS